MGAARAEAPRVVAVQRVDVQDRKAVIATVEPVHELLARSRIGGTVASVLVKEGDSVQAGDRVALIADEKLSLQMQAIESRIEAQKAAVDKAQLDYDRARKLRASGAVSQARLDDATTQLNMARKTYQALGSDRDVVMQQAKEGAVLAPGAGRVLTVPIAAGSVVMSGETLATIAADNYILRLQLPERHARFLKAGDKILVGDRGMQVETNGMREGEVVLVYPHIDEGRVVADVRVDGLGDYFVGERTRVWIATGTRDALVVPQAALHQRYGVTYVTLKNGVEVAVQPGNLTESGIEVLAGLREGDEVLVP
ncbi:MAG: efflux RND transporter periplasmic adaptor subunit [Rhizobiales bacterium]|nr:efflux RND transporter periplasmic adaptor subunit [Hyphomicrobiales bacterium]